MSEATQRDTSEVQAWYRKNDTKAEIGFDPDGMCLKICRTARNIGPGAQSALSSALMTPKQYRVYNIEDIKAGMVLYFGAPNDSNPFDHIVTAMAWEEGSPRKNLSDLITRTNSVKSDMVVPVRADYFIENWDDPFIFAAWWLNGEPFYDLAPKKPGKKPLPKPKPKPKPELLQIKESIASMTTSIKHVNAAIKHHEKKGHDLFVHDLRENRRKMLAARAALIQTYTERRR